MVHMLFQESATHTVYLLEMGFQGQPCNTRTARCLQPGFGRGLGLLKVPNHCMKCPCMRSPSRGQAETGEVSSQQLLPRNPALPMKKVEASCSQTGTCNKRALENIACQHESPANLQSWLAASLCRRARPPAGAGHARVGHVSPEELRRPQRSHSHCRPCNRTMPCWYSILHAVHDRCACDHGRGLNHQCSR